MAPRMTEVRAAVITDAEAISASLCDPDAFAPVFDRHFDALHRYLARRLGAHLADELAADVFAIAFAKRAGYDPAFVDARPWLYGIATRLVSRHRRRETRELRAYARTGTDPATPDHGDGAAGRADAAAAGPALAAALAALSPDERDVLLLYAWEGLAYPEIALALSIPSGPSGPGCTGRGSARAGRWPLRACSTYSRRSTMDELDLIRNFREGQPPPQDAARERAQRAWQAPERFRRQGSEHPGHLAPARRGRPARPRRPRTRIALVAAATAVAAGVAVVTFDTGGRDLGTADARAARTLERAAVAAQADPLARPLRAGEYWYVRRQTAYETTGFAATATTGTKSPPMPKATEFSSDGEPYTYVVPSVREDWTAPDGSGRFRARPVAPPRLATPRDRARWVAAGRPELRGDRFDERKAAGATPINFGRTPLSYQQLLALPTDPKLLYARLRAAATGAGGSSVEDETFTVIGDVLRDTAVPGPLRAAFLRAAALIPGVRHLEGERDLLGRPGVGVAFDDQGRRDVLIFDPQAHTLLGEQTRLLEPGDREDPLAGRVLSGDAVVSVGIVESPERTPAPDRRHGRPSP